MFPVVPAGTEPPSLPAFIIARNGIFLRKTSKLGLSQTRVPNVQHLPELQPELEYKLGPIPAALSGQIAGFLLRCDREKKGEGAILLCLDDKGEWQIVIPPQDNSGFDVKYFIEPDTVPQGWTLVGTVHSHPFSKSPVASSTDEADERKIDGVHLVAGSLDKNPQYGAAVVINGTRFKWTNWQELIEPAEPTDVPDEWLAKVKDKSLVQKVVSTVTSYGYSYGGSYGISLKEGETAEDAIARYDKGSLNFLSQDAAKLGYKFKWELVPMDEADDEGHDEVDEPLAVKPITTYDSVQVGEGGKIEPPQPVQLSALPQDDDDIEDWRSIAPVRCKGKHPNKMSCPNNCGCHCTPCKEKIVGAYDAREGGVLGVDTTECECKVCYNGCDDFVPVGKVNWNAKWGANLCDDCSRGSHYEDKGSALIQGGTM